MTRILLDENFLALGVALIYGVPNCLYGDVPHEDIQANLDTDNLPAAVRKPALSTTAIKKEERTHLSLCFDSLVTSFTPNLGLIKLGIVQKEGKKDCMYRHGS